jgi:hypothetical protein
MLFVRSVSDRWCRGEKGPLAPKFGGTGVVWGWVKWVRRNSIDWVPRWVYWVVIVGYCLNLRKAKVTLWPPKPKELDRTTSTSCSRLTLAT